MILDKPTSANTPPLKLRQMAGLMVTLSGFAVLLTQGSTIL